MLAATTAFLHRDHDPVDPDVVRDRFAVERRRIPVTRCPASTGRTTAPPYDSPTVALDPRTRYGRT